MDRVTELERFAASLEAHEGVVSAWLAKSFEDRVLFLEVPSGEPVPDDVRERIREAGLAGMNEVYGLDGEAAFAGNVGNREQYRFVDVGDRTAQTTPI